jgi:chorismate-pyruvate lyase
MTSLARHGPQLRSLFALFPNAALEMPAYETVPAEEVPAPYDSLLVHAHHMTVTVEKFHSDRVDVRVLDKRQDGESYARKILLALHGRGRIVQFGIVRMRLDCCGRAVREEVLSGKTPLGRILIQHKVMRRIEPTAYLRVVPSAAMMEWFGLTERRPTYGRLAIIHCNGTPAVELLEIVAPT